MSNAQASSESRTFTPSNVRRWATLAFLGGLLVGIVAAIGYLIL